MSTHTEFLLRGKTINLRALEPADLCSIYNTENDCSEWHHSETLSPFSRYTLEKYISNANKDIYETKQLRLVISENKTSHALGFLDWFEFDPKNKRAGIGIIISQSFRNRGVGSEALEIAVRYSFLHLGLRQTYATIAETNTPSLRLFLKTGFEVFGRKKDWFLIHNKPVDALFLQKFNITPFSI